MNNVNKTLFIPLFGKATVSKKGIILKDKKAEEIWEKESFPIKGKARSKWLSYFMSMRAKVFDEWTKKQIRKSPHAVVFHIGCGLDSRVLRVGKHENLWYDIDFPDVIKTRRKYFSETEKYKMLPADASDTSFLSSLDENDNAVVIMEGVSMYLKNEEVINLYTSLGKKFKKVNILMDVYTPFAAKATKIKNPINEVGVTEVYGIGSPDLLTVNNNIGFVKEHTMTPKRMVDMLRGFDKIFFNFIFAGKLTRKIYRLFEFEINS